MPRALTWRTFGLVLLLASLGRAQQLPKCSTQKVNGDCAWVFDRLDPLSPPTIQMRPNARVHVTVVGPLPYETLTLDPQSFQAIAPADQTQGFVTALMPSLKGVTTPTVSPQFKAKLEMHVTVGNDVQQVKNDLLTLASYLDNPFPDIQTFVMNAENFYGQIQEAVAPLPRPRDATGTPVRPATIPMATPFPWNSYAEWRTVVLCELSAPECAPEVKVLFRDVLVTGMSVQTSLTPPPQDKPTVPPPPPPLRFDTQRFDSLATKISQEISSLKPEDHPDKYTAMLADLQTREVLVVKAVPAYAAAWLPGITAINKDLQTYFVNIKETAGTVATDFLELGCIDDPRRLSDHVQSNTRFLGRLVTYSVNSVNQIGVTTTAVATTAQKTSIATLTVLYADPIFEVSTGVLFSTLPNRTFANQTLVNVMPGTIPTTGDIIITQSIIRPIVLPYVAANWRLGHDFLIDGRRSAIYFTTAVGFNAYNTTAEYAIGPSLSWRMIMLSPLFHIGHDIHLTQGETVGQVWCNSSASAGSPTACTGAPPAPSSKTYWRGAFALGVGIRVPTSFGTTAGH